LLFLAASYLVSAQFDLGTARGAAASYIILVCSITRQATSSSTITGFSINYSSVCNGFSPPANWGGRV
jgi:hypothetical protein